MKAFLLRLILERGLDVTASLLASIFASDPTLVTFFRSMSVRFESLMKDPSRKEQ